MASAVEQEYTFATVSRILGVPEPKLRYWSQSGFVGPSRRRGARPRATSQMVACASQGTGRARLLAAQIPRPWMPCAPRFPR